MRFGAKTLQAITTCKYNSVSVIHGGCGYSDNGGGYDNSGGGYGDSGGGYGDSGGGYGDSSGIYGDSDGDENGGECQFIKLKSTKMSQMVTIGPKITNQALNQSIH